MGRRVANCSLRFISCGPASRMIFVKLYFESGTRTAPGGSTRFTYDVSVSEWSNVTVVYTRSPTLGCGQGMSWQLAVLNVVSTWTFSCTWKHTDSAQSGSTSTHLAAV